MDQAMFDLNSVTFIFIIEPNIILRTDKHLIIPSSPHKLQNDSMCY